MSARSLVLGAAAAGLTLVPLAACSPASGGAKPEGQGGSVGGFPGSGGFDTSEGGAGIIPIGGAPPALGSGGGAQTGGGGDCGSSNFQSKLLPSNILFLVDRSGSMNCNLPPTTESTDCEANPVAKIPTDPTKWSVITTSMASALDQIATTPNSSVGLTFFSNDDVCGVTSKPNVDLGPLAAGGPQLTALKNALTNGNPKGGTPIIGATILAFKHLHQQAQAPGNRFVVLVTDGADSCISKYAEQGVTGDVKARLLTEELPKAASVNIRTFVIGAPGSEGARGLLSKIAFAGGTAKAADCDHDSDTPAAGAECHFDMTRSGDFGTDLSNALKKITGEAVTCDFDVPVAGDGKTVDAGKLNVDYFKNGSTADADRSELVRDDNCTSTEQGWHFLDGSDQKKIQLCKSTCDTVQTDPKANIVVSLSCKPQRIPR